MQANENPKKSRAARTALRDAILVLAIAAIGTTIHVRVDRPSLVGEAVAADPRPAVTGTNVEETGGVDRDAVKRAAQARRPRIERLEQRVRALAEVHALREAPVPAIAPDHAAEREAADRRPVIVDDDFAVSMRVVLSAVQG